MKKLTLIMLTLVLSLSTMFGQTLTITVTDGMDPIEGAMVSMTDDAITQDGVTDLNGEVVFTYSVSSTNCTYLVSAEGFDDIVDANVTVDGTNVNEVASMTLSVKSFAFVVYDELLYDPLMGGGELEGATVVLTAGETTYSATTLGDLDAGFANFTDVVYGTYDYAVSMNGFITSTGTFTVNSSTNGGLFVGLTPVKSFAFVVYDESLYDPLMGGGELEGATVVLTAGETTYSATTLGDLDAGFANFTDVVYGTYDYAVSMNGFITSTGTFTVNSSTNGGLFVGLTPVKSFAFVVYDELLYNPLMGGGELEGATVVLTAGETTYSATTLGDLDAGFANFTDVVYGTYDYAVSMNGFITSTGTFTVNSSTNGGLFVGLTPVKSFAFVVYDELLYNPLMGGGELEGATVVLTAGETTYSATTLGDLDAGFANFTDVVYGTYDYAVSMNGFITSTGTFTVNSSTNGGLFVGLTPVKSFAFVVYDELLYDPLMGGGELEGATVVLTAGETTYSATTLGDLDAGFANFTDVVYGTYDYAVSMNGFITSTGTFTVNSSTNGGLFVGLTPVKSFAFVVYDELLYDPLMGGGELEGATVVLTAGETTYSATTLGDLDAGFANFTDVVYGTYDYAVSMNGFITSTGTFTVNSSTNGGLFVGLTPVKSFAFVVYDELLYNPLMGGGELEGATVVLTAGETTYSATTLGDLDAGFANFTDVVYGTYDYAVSMNGFITSTGTFTVNSSTNGGLFVGLTPVKSFAFVVYDESLYDPLMGGGELEGATVVLTAGETTYSATTLGDLDAGFANFTDVVYGTYDYAVSMNGFITSTGTFTVNSSTNGGLFVGLTPVKSFAFVVYDESLYDPLMGGGELEGATVVLTAGETTYSATTLGDLDAGFANFTDVVYGTYDYVISMNGFITSTGTFTVNSSTNGGLFVGLSTVTTGIDNTKKVNISLYPNPVFDVLYIQSEVEVNSVEVYNLSGSLVKTVQGSSISSVQVSDLASGIYLVKVKNTEGFVSNVKVQKR